MNGKILKSQLIFGIFAFLILLGSFFFFSGLKTTEKSGEDKASQKAQNYSKELFVGAILQTNFGEIEIEFATGTASFAVSNFVKLAREVFYDGTLFHRVTKEFIQGGDPLTKGADRSVYGTGGPGYKFKDEINPNDRMVRGTVAMANFGPDTNGSQFFIIVIKEASWLEGKHTIFAKVKRGMDVVDKISSLKTSKNDLPMEQVVLERVVLK